MSNRQWHEDQAIGERALREWEDKRKRDAAKLARLTAAAREVVAQRDAMGPPRIYQASLRCAIEDLAAILEEAKR